MSYKEKIILEIRHCKTAVGNRKPKILQWEYLSQAKLQIVTQIDASL